MSEPSHAAVGIVIPTFNGCEMLRECLQCLRRQTFTNFVVRVVDNASTDGTREMLAAEFPDVQVLAMTWNTGFSIAVNAGIRAGVEAYVAPLNNDACPEPAWLEQLVARAEAHPEESSWASVLTWKNRPGFVETAGLSIYEDGSPACLYRDRAVGDLPAEPVAVLGACAGAALYRRAMLDEVGLFDERFLFYVEDVDLSIRAQLAGHRCALVPSARAEHRHMATSRRRPNLAAYLQYRNLVLYLVKNMPALWLLRKLPRYALTGASPLLFSPWKALGWVFVGAKFGIFWNLPYALGERRRIRGQMRARDEAVFALFASRRDEAKFLSAKHA